MFRRDWLSKSFFVFTDLRPNTAKQKKKSQSTEQECINNILSLNFAQAVATSFKNGPFSPSFP